MGLFDDVSSFLGDVSDVIQQGSELYSDFAGTGTSVAAPATGYATNPYGPAPVTQIPTWVWFVIGGVVIYALAGGVRSSK